MSITRHQIREIAFQTLFAINSNSDTDANVVIDSLLEEKHLSQRPEYLMTLVNGVLEHQNQLDDLISSKLDAKWTLSRLNKIDLIILRLSLFEIKYVQDVPGKVALNEALQLAKEFSDEKERGFINGVLSNFI
ncbi:MAG TPA: transcription antitermination factor NusB [Candidatus Ligilactobacillus excrementigallinarum]|uniref:Transcription antitermination protein NusB n=1 Tax=Candidatus Ligilactobacillus excrementigallinarum TaxID=2838641 RepID=A0A9D1UW49_9LACO|nr:transcription antitermination factor NusB [Candidatus Ligilactobacillus excrementigallinarum]